MANKKKSNDGKMIMMVAGGIVGAFAGFMLTKSIGLSGRSSFNVKKLLEIVIMLVSLGVSYFLGIIIHESGHLVMGLLTGYKFVSFRIGSYILVKQEGKFSVKRFAVAGTAGQCLMTHELVEKDEDIPYFWYNFGGVLFNFVSAALLGLVYLNTSSKYLALYCGVGAFIYLFLGVMNFLPLKKFGLANDGSNILDCFRDINARRAMLNVLIVNGEQAQGKTLDSMPEELFTVSEDQHSLSALNILLLRAAVEIEKGNYEAAKAQYKVFLERDDLVDIFVKECKCDLLFCDIMTGESAAVIDELYDELQKYIQQSGKFVLCRHRLMYAYYYIYKQDKMNADKEYNLAVEMARTAHNLGDAKAEMGIIERIKLNN